MSLETNKKIRLIYGILLSVLLVATGVCLILSCLDIYQNGGEHPYTREGVETAFGKIAILVYVTIGAVVVGGTLTWIFPTSSPKVKGQMPPKATITRLWRRVDAHGCDSALLAKMQHERKFRLISGIVATIFCVALAVPAIIYFCNLDHFTKEAMTDNVISAMYYVLPASVLGLGAWVAVSLMWSRSLQREVTAVKEALKTSPVKEKAPQPTVKDNNRMLWIVRGVVLVVAVVFVVLGIVNGGMTDVLEKAIKICTECIGLG